MSLTLEQLQLRRKGITASEAGAVLSLSPWETPTQVYYRKVAGPQDQGEPTAAMESGNRLEPVIIQWCADRLGVKLDPNPGTVKHPTLPLLATPDALIRYGSEGIEAKKSSMPDEWGAEGTDEIPLHYLVQAHTQIRVLNLRRVWVPVFMLTGWREEWRLYCVNRDDAAGEAIESRLVDFWRNHVERRVPPSDEAPSLELFKRLRRQPATVRVLGQEGIDAWQHLDDMKQQRKAAEEAEDAAKRAVLALLGIEEPAEAAQLPDGRLITYLSQRSAPSLDSARLKAEFPDAYQACLHQGTHRTLRIKKPKP